MGFLADEPLKNARDTICPDDWREVVTIAQIEKAVNPPVVDNGDGTSSTLPIPTDWQTLPAYIEGFGLKVGPTFSWEGKRPEKVSLWEVSWSEEESE